MSHHYYEDESYDFTAGMLQDGDESERMSEPMTDEQRRMLIFDAKDIEALHDEIRRLREENEWKKDLMRCVECEGWFDYKTMQPSSVDPQCAPICDRCLTYKQARELLETASHLLDAMNVHMHAKEIRTFLDASARGGKSETT